jgi:hypothetical protein
MTTVANVLSEAIKPFERLFVQKRSWNKAQELMAGALLCRGQRTMSRVLRVLGLEQDPGYGKYYRMMSRVGWSGLKGAQLLLATMVGLLLSSGPIVIGIDETLERRWGPRIWGLGLYRDSVKSTHKYRVTSSGVRWQVMQLLVRLPWSSRVWGLPFLTVMAPAKSASRPNSQRYKTILDWAIQMVSVVSHWLKRPWICVADGAYGNAKFGWACRRRGVSLVARLPWKASLYDFIPRLHSRKPPGRPRTKGLPLPKLQRYIELLGQPLTYRSPACSAYCQSVEGLSNSYHRLKWYGQSHAVRQLLSGTALWDVEGYPPLPIRWVMVIDPTGEQPPTPLFSTNLALSPAQIVELYVSRWSLEVTFEEARAHLGFESQRQWSKPATTRTTPVLLALFSLTCISAFHLHSLAPLSPANTAWYFKSNLAFSDLLEAVRVSLWRSRLFPRLPLGNTPTLSPDPQHDLLIHLLSSPF